MTSDRVDTSRDPAYWRDEALFDRFVFYSDFKSRGDVRADELEESVWGSIIVRGSKRSDFYSKAFKYFTTEMDSCSETEDYETAASYLRAREAFFDRFILPALDFPLD